MIFLITYIITLYDLKMFYEDFSIHHNPSEKKKIIFTALNEFKPWIRDPEERMEETGRIPLEDIEDFEISQLFGNSDFVTSIEENYLYGSLEVYPFMTLRQAIDGDIYDELPGGPGGFLEPLYIEGYDSLQEILNYSFSGNLKKKRLKLKFTDAELEIFNENNPEINWPFFFEGFIKSDNLYFSHSSSPQEEFFGAYNLYDKNFQKLWSIYLPIEYKDEVSTEYAFPEHCMYYKHGDLDYFNNEVNLVFNYFLINYYRQEGYLDYCVRYYSYDTSTIFSSSFAVKNFFCEESHKLKRYYSLTTLIKLPYNLFSIPIYKDPEDITLLYDFPTIVEDDVLDGIYASIDSIFSRFEINFAQIMRSSFILKTNDYYGLPIDKYVSFNNKFSLKLYNFVGLKKNYDNNVTLQKIKSIENNSFDSRINNFLNNLFNDYSEKN